MSISTPRLGLMALFVAAAAATSGCGGGSASPAPSPSPSPSPAPAPAPTAQSISFTTPGAQTLGVTPAALSATATSGLSVSFASTTTAVCTVSGTTLTLVSAGDCTIEASQSGNSTYDAATPVSRTFTVSTLKFSTGFAAGGLSVEGGSYGGYSGNDPGWNCSGANPAECGDFSGTTATPLPAADTYAGRYNQTTVAKGGEYVGVYVQAPGVVGVNLAGTATDVAGLQVTGQTKMSFTFNQNPEWYNGSANNFYVLLTMGKGYSGNCRVQLHQVVTPTSVDATRYTINLADFEVAQDCGDTTMDTVQEALANSTIAQVDVQGLGGTSAKTVNGKTSGSNLTVATGGGVIPTTVVLKGAIDFQ